MINFDLGLRLILLKRWHLSWALRIISILREKMGEASRLRGKASSVDKWKDMVHSERAWKYHETRRAEDTLGGQIGNVGLGWILKAVPAVLKSLPFGWACWPCGCCCTTVLLPSEYLFISLWMIFPALNPHSDYIPWGRDQVGIVHCSIAHSECPAQSRCLVNPGCLDEGMYISFYLWVMVCHCRFAVWDWDSIVMCLRRSVLVCSMN